MDEQGSRVRLFVGGLGPAVEASDLQRAFGSLGAVHSVEMIRSKHRDFAYIDFDALSPAALRKVFSTFKGCKWKGGCLRVEIAKEHYLQRLEREWAAAREDASKDERKDDEQQPRMPMVPVTRELKIFFPRTRKVKVVTGGKHKRSFERCVSHPLPLLTLCSCGEHQEEEAADPFDFEHRGYLRLVEELESKHPDEDASTRAGNLCSDTPEASKSKRELSKREECTGQELGEDPSSRPQKKAKKITRSGNKVEDNFVAAALTSEDQRHGNDQPGVKTDLKEENKVLEEQSEEEVDEDGVVLPGLMREKKVKVEASGNAKWEDLFGAAAGLRDSEDVSDDLFEEKNIEDDKSAVLEHELVPDKEKADDYLSEKTRRTKVDNEADEVAVKTQETANKKNGSELRKRSKATAASGKLSQDERKQGPWLPEQESRTISSEKVDGTQEDPHGKSEVRAVAGDSSVQQKQQTWTRFSSWKSLVGDGNGAFSLSAITGTKPEKQQEAREFTPLAVPDVPKFTGNLLETRQVRTPKKIIRELTKDESMKPQESKPPPSVKILLEKKTCSFMRSSDAEEAWLASRDKLSLDYKSKHRTAMRIKRKS